ncbi:acyl-CoA N-acyltransferase [Auricularia subglabra TFB-10046 SS5]|nr:acyl-CoA N-acyltransferase [Auricularia subglabra TFB-10046 SS5]
MSGTDIDRDFRLDTPRLYLSHWDAESAQQVAFALRLCNGAAVVAAPGDSGIHTPDEARAFVESRREHHVKHRFGSYLVSLKDTNEPIGTAGIVYHGEHTIPDVGFVFLDEVHGKGYATEAARALIEHVREKHRVSQIMGFTGPGNAASRRTLERLGLVYRATMTLEAFQARGADEVAVYATPDLGNLAAYGVVDTSGTS